MAQMMPQEIAVWYVIPSLRRELAKQMIRLGANQRTAAKVLCVTEAAVSQYIKFKRAQGFKFSPKQLEMIKQVAGKMLKDEKNSMRYLMTLTNVVMFSDQMCSLHKREDKSLPKNCRICFS